MRADEGWLPDHCECSQDNQQALIYSHKHNNCLFWPPDKVHLLLVVCGRVRGILIEPNISPSTRVFPQQTCIYETSCATSAVFPSTVDVQVVSTTESSSPPSDTDNTCSSPTLVLSGLLAGASLEPGIRTPAQYREDVETQPGM